MAWAGMDKDKVVLSGHSLGSQIAGCIGRTISFKISEIMAMDPAGPFFGFPEPTITATDAKCVKCIHSDMGDHGTVVPCGYQDYYPNGGRRIQPGCPLDLRANFSSKPTHRSLMGEAYKEHSTINRLCRMIRMYLVFNILTCCYSLFHIRRNQQ
ncbi:lipase member I-like isoform X2 [Halictus rubicundus]|uniref:lipase member I-like isoform X2 n=1 Tax=Halictus rubicundus TaxID=77578 RepID=UPI0040353252